MIFTKKKEKEKIGWKKILIIALDFKDRAEVEDFLEPFQGKSSS